MAPSQDDLLKSFHLWVDPETRALICTRHGCKHALCINGSRVTTHLRDKHGITTTARRGLTGILRAVHLCNADEAPHRRDGTPEHPMLHVHEGFSSGRCRFRTIHFPSIKRHISESHGCSGGTRLPSPTDMDEIIKHVFLQTWAAGPSRKYWIVRRNGRLDRPVARSDNVGEIMVAQRRGEARFGPLYDQLPDDKSSRPNLPRNRFARRSPWMERTEWDETYKMVNRGLLLWLRRLPSTNRCHGAGPTSTYQLPGADGRRLDRSVHDEQKIKTVLQVFDMLLDRCEETARRTSRHLLCWLKSTKPLTCYPKPFTLVQLISTTRKYRRLFKVILVMVLRAYRLPLAVRQVGFAIPLSEEQVHYVGRILDHSSVSGIETFNSRQCESLAWLECGQDAPRRGHVKDDAVLMGDTQASDSDDDQDTEDGGQSDEGWSDEDQDGGPSDTEEEHLDQNTYCEKDSAADGPISGLTELVFGLCLALCTQPFVDGQPQKTALVYLSGVLGFSDHAQSFRAARSYTSDLSGLIYIQRLLFLECAIPLRSYPSLGISCRPRMELLGRLDLVRRRYMVAGSEFPFAEMMSLRDYGRKIARSDTPAFLLRWSMDGLTVFLGDTFCVSMDQFRLLPTHFISQARHLCAELLFGWEPPVDLYTVRDDLSNMCSGYSFVQHPQNRLRNEHLQLRCRWSKAANGSSVPILGAHNHSRLSQYFEKEQLFQDALAGCMHITGGQLPRATELLSLSHTNTETCARGIYVYNGSMVYITRHHKAKASTNREFIVARFLPLQVGHLLYKYLVYIRPFVGLLRRSFGVGIEGTNPLLFCSVTADGVQPWRTGRLTAALKDATTETWIEAVGSQCLRQLCIGITEKHVREVHRPFNRFDDKSNNAQRNVVFAWQSGHRPMQRGMTYGLDGAFPTDMQPQLLQAYEWASTQWHEFINQASKRLPMGAASTTERDTSPGQPQPHPPKGQVSSSTERSFDVRNEHMSLRHILSIAPEPTESIVPGQPRRMVDHQIGQTRKHTDEIEDRPSSHSSKRRCLASDEAHEALKSPTQQYMATIDWLVYHDRYRVLVCKVHGYAISSLSSHLTKQHSDIDRKTRSAILSRYSSAVLSRPDHATFCHGPTNPLPAIEGLTVHDGLACAEFQQCHFLSTNTKLLKVHCKEQHGWQLSKADPTHWTEVKLQTFFTVPGNTIHYFCVTES